MELDDICTACGEDSPEDECSESERPCGHHCNHSWSHDQCCWCDKEWGEEKPKPDVMLIGSPGILLAEVGKLIRVDIGCGLIVEDNTPILPIEAPPRDFKIPDMDGIMIEVKNKETSRKKNLAKMGRDQFKKKNRRKF